AGYAFHWVHVRRNSHPAMVRADGVAGKVRAATDAQREALTNGEGEGPGRDLPRGKWGRAPVGMGPLAGRNDDEAALPPAGDPSAGGFRGPAPALPFLLTTGLLGFARATGGYMIRFACPGCSTAYSVAPDRAGKRTRCPRCHTPLMVPTPRGL